MKNSIVVCMACFAATGGGRSGHGAVRRRAGDVGGAAARRLGGGGGVRVGVAVPRCPRGGAAAVVESPHHVEQRRARRPQSGLLGGRQLAGRLRGVGEAAVEKSIFLYRRSEFRFSVQIFQKQALRVYLQRQS